MIKRQRSALPPLGGGADGDIGGPDVAGVAVAIAACYARWASFGGP